MIIYHKGDMFEDTPRNSILTHACNCKGVWGSGIAVQFREKFPAAFREYHEACELMGDHLIGTARLIPTGDRIIGCLFTSKDYGDRKDSEDLILDQTFLSVSDLTFGARILNHTIHMPKINSGRFAVPWEKTVAVLNQFPQSDFHVWEVE